jgi:hypothetical protein
MIVTKDLISRRLVRLLDARDSQGKTFLEALESMTEEEKRKSRVALRLHYGLPADPLDAQPIN